MTRFALTLYRAVPVASSAAVALAALVLLLVGCSAAVPATLIHDSPRSDGPAAMEGGAAGGSRGAAVTVFSNGRRSCSRAAVVLPAGEVAV